MNITEIELQNFKTIKEFKKEFSGGIYLVTGENEIGKSTLLGAISTLLTGERTSNLLKQGEEKGFAKIKVGEYVVELKFTEKNPRGSLTITTETGMKSDNKSMLQSILKYQDFDAHEFAGWSHTAEGRRKQVELVKGLLPLEVQETLNQIDSDINQAKEDRKEINSSYKAYEVMAKQKKPSFDIGEYESGKEIVVKELYDQKQNAVTKNQQRQAIIERGHERQEYLNGFEDKTASQTGNFDAEINRLSIDLHNAKDQRTEYIKERKDELEELNTKQSKSKEWIEENPEIDTLGIDEKINKADVHNERHTHVLDYLKVKKDLESFTDKKKSTDENIEGMLKDKKAIIDKSDLPIKGLMFTDDGLTLDGVPFAPGEVSSSQEMEVAAKLIIAKNPTVKVFRIAQGESLGSARLKSIIDFANKNGYQGFIEEVKRGQNELRVEKYSHKS